MLWNVKRSVKKNFKKKTTITDMDKMMLDLMGVEEEEILRIEEEVQRNYGKINN